MAIIPQTQLRYIKNLYYDKELSASEIAKMLGVSIDAVYYFMRRSRLERRSLPELNRIRFNRKQPSFNLRVDLTQEDKELKVLGTMLYWAEGFNASSADYVDFANSNPDMVGLFLKFLRKICGVDESKLRAFIYCYSNQNVKNLIGFWSNLTHIPKEQFTKPYIRRDFDVKKTGKMKHGLIHIRYGDKKLLNLMGNWTREYVKRFA